jgi:hypothetical protein
MSHVPTTFGKTSQTPKKAAAARRFGFASRHLAKQIVAHHVRLRDQSDIGSERAAPNDQWGSK